MKNLRSIFIILIGIILVTCNKNKETKPSLDNNKFDNIKYEIATKDSLMAKNIQNFLKLYYLKDDLKFIPKEERKFQFYKIDLNSDGKDEYFVRLFGNYFCGSGGCTFLLLDRYAEVITKFTVSTPPFYVFKETNKGWKILSVFSAGENRLLKFNGKSYPSNPSIAPNYDLKSYTLLKSLFDENNLKSYTYYY